MERPGVALSASAGAGRTVRTRGLTMLRDMAFVGLGLVVVSANTAKEAFNTLSRRGETARREGRTMAAGVDHFVTRECPAALGQALGAAADGAVRGVEAVLRARRAVPIELMRATETLLRRVDVPTSADLADLRRRLDALSARLDDLARSGGQRPESPWEEPADAGNATH